MVKEIIVSLAKDLEETVEGEQLHWKSIPAEEYWRKDVVASMVIGFERHCERLLTYCCRVPAEEAATLSYSTVQSRRMSKLCNLPTLTLD